MKNIVENQDIKTDKPLVMSYEALKAERDALTDRVNALAVENAALKDAITTHSQSTHFCELCGKDDPCSTDDVCYALNETPATDAALAEIKAQGLDELANACDGYAENHVYTFTKRHAEEFAASLREAK